MSRGANDDEFARIAGEDAGQQRPGLIEPEPLPVEAPLLEASPDASRFQPMERVDNEAALNRLLAEARERHAPFLENHAPSVPQTRCRQPLETFDWRMADARDAADQRAVEAGSGEWESVRLPHYGGPVGKATAYYRCVFDAEAGVREQARQWLCFEGVDYIATVFLNGCFVGRHEGFFAPFEFEVGHCLRAEGNVLLVVVENDALPKGLDTDGGVQVGKKIYAATGLGWDDPAQGWHHCPPGMGIHRPVRLEGRADLWIEDVFFRPRADLESAEIWVDLGCARETGRHSVDLRLSLYGRNFTATFFEDRAYPNPPELAHGRNTLRLAVKLPEARIWEPDTPWLYQLNVALNEPGGALLDAATRQCGLRWFEMETEGAPKGRLRLNGRPIRLRGANTMGFEQLDVMREDWDRLRDDILLAKVCRMNFLRLTQRPVEREVYEYCDRLGLITQTDLPLFGFFDRTQFAEVLRQAGEMERLVRNHPCNVMVTFINEPFPDARPGHGGVRCLLREELEDCFIPAAERAVRLQHPDRVIKPVDGDIAPPAPGLPDKHCYTFWYNGHGLPAGKLYRGYWTPAKPGWYYGCGEFGAEGLDHRELMEQHYPAEWLPEDPDDREWTPNSIVRSQTHRHHFTFYDTPDRFEEWIETSRAYQARAVRLQTECFRRDPRMVSFALHLFIDAWPAGWMKAVMDCERRPKPAFFAYREALAPLLLTLRGDRDKFFAGEAAGEVEVWLSNDRDAPAEDLVLRWQVEDAAGEMVAGGDGRVSVAADTADCVTRLPLPIAGQVEGRSLRMVRAQVVEASGEILSENEFVYTVYSEVGAGVNPVGLLARPDGPARALAQALGLPVVEGDAILNARESPEVLLVDDWEDWQKRAAELCSLIEAGLRVVFHGLAPGDYGFFGHRVRIEPVCMHPRNFVSRKTGHPLVSGFAPNDFHWWYDPALDRVEPLLENTFEIADGWQPILTTGQGLFGQPWHRTAADAELRIGEGSLILSCLRLAPFVEAVPPARAYARRLLGQGQG